MTHLNSYERKFEEAPQYSIVSIQYSTIIFGFILKKNVTSS